MVIETGFLNTDFLRSDEIYLKLCRTDAGDPARLRVPAYHFQICRCEDDTPVGCCDLRIGHTQRLFFGGNIGYSVQADHRGHHYAGKACLLLFALARRHDLGYLLIACSPDNIASRKTCEYAGCELLCIADLPTDYDLYAMGDRHKCIYRIAL